MTTSLHRLRTLDPELVMKRMKVQLTPETLDRMNGAQLQLGIGILYMWSLNYSSRQLEEVTDSQRDIFSRNVHTIFSLMWMSHPAALITTHSRDLHRSDLS